MSLTRCRLMVSFHQHFGLFMEIGTMNAKINSNFGEKSRDIESRKFKNYKKKYSKT